MADITYFDAGYVEDNYFVYTANAQVQLALYLDANYLAEDYFTDQNAAVTLTCTAQRIRFVLVSANLVSDLALAVINTRDRRTSVTLETKANLVSAVVRLRDHTASFTANSQHQIQYQRTRNILVNFDSTVAQLSIAARNARGLIVMESRVTMTALVGVIRQFTLVSAVGVSSNSEAAATRTPYLKYGTAQTSVNTFQSRMLWSFYLAKPIGFIFDSDNNSPATNSAAVLPNGLQVESDGGIPSFFYQATGGVVQFQLANVSNNVSAEFNSVYRHYLFCVDLSKSTTAEKFRLFLDGTELPITAITGSDFRMRVYGSYNLMMQTSGTGVNKRIAVQSSGYGDDVGHLTQFWWDYGAASYDLSPAARAQFYPGFYQSLGLNGTATGLAQPKHFVNLANVDDLLDGGTENDSWVWRQLQGQDGSQFLTEVPFYTAPQNSDRPLRGLRVISQFVVEANAVIITTAAFAANTQITVPTLRTRLCEAAITGLTVVTVTAARTRDNIVSITADSSITAQGTRQQPGASAIASEVTVTCDTTRIQPMQATLATESDLTCAAGEITQGQIDIDTTVSVLAVVTRILSTVSAQVTANTIVTPLVNAQFDHTAQMSADTVATTDTTRLRDHTIESDTDCVLVCDSVVFEGVDAVITVQSVVTCETQVVKVTAVPLVSEFTQISAGIKVVDMQANLVMQGFALTVVIVINIATELQITVTQETRQRQVTPESRQFAVPQATRTRVIARETRLLQVNPQTGVNIV